MYIEIKRWDKEKVIHSGEFDSVKDCLEDGVKKLISFEYADLREANLRGADLRYAKLRYANLRNTDLRNTNLSFADLRYTDLSFADLSFADLRNTDLSFADLSFADLRNTNLSFADLRYTQGIYIFNAYDTSKRVVYCTRHYDTFMCHAGCFYGTLDELEAKVLTGHGSKVYLGNIAIMRELLKENQ